MATIAEMIAAKQSQDEIRRQALNARMSQGIHANNNMAGVLTPAELSASVRITRAKEYAEAAKQEARDRKRRKLIEALRHTRMDRDRIISHVLSLTVVRKDGKNVAKPRCKKMRDQYLTDLARCNTLLVTYERELNGLSDTPRKERLVSRFQRIQQRDVLVHEIATSGKNGCKVGGLDAIERMREECKWLNETFCRPRNGYPRPPFRRSKDYPVGAANGHVKGQNELVRLSGEMDRLAEYARTLYAQENASERVCRLDNHLRHMSSERIALGDEMHVRKTGKTYQTKRDSRS
jgi:hypothetical protein